MNCSNIKWLTKVVTNGNSNQDNTYLTLIWCASVCAAWAVWASATKSTSSPVKFTPFIRIKFRKSNKRRKEACVLKPSMCSLRINLSTSAPSAPTIHCPPSLVQNFSWCDESFCSHCSVSDLFYVSSKGDVTLSHFPIHFICTAVSRSGKHLLLVPEPDSCGMTFLFPLMLLITE